MHALKNPNILDTENKQRLISIAGPMERVHILEKNAEQTIVNKDTLKTPFLQTNKVVRHYIVLKRNENLG